MLQPSRGISFYRQLAAQALGGLVVGYLLLHPISMVIFSRLDSSRSSHIGSADPVNVMRPIVHSFRMDMVPMGLVFAAVSGLIAVVYGYYRSIVILQRDDLAWELALNHRSQRQLEKQAEQLRTQNDQLDRLEKANRRNTRFMVHDFKTRLGCILGFSDLLLGEKSNGFDKRTQTALQRIHRQAHQMMGEVNDLLECARLEEKPVIRRESVHLSELFVDVLNDFSLPFQKSNIQLGSGQKRCPPLWADPRLLHRVLTNLVSNAFKHNGPGTKVIIDSVFSEDRSEVLFWCRDNGAGIPKEVLPTLFEDFEAGATQAQDSTGLGLAFCKAAVSAHGGRIWCESKEGGGSCFYFTIPEREENPDE